MTDQPDSPLPAGLNGRAAGGRFAAGNKAGRGNPNNKRVQRLRNAFIKAVTRADMRDIAAAMVKEAKAGDVSAAREICDRILGRPVQTDVLARIEELENAEADRAQEQR